VTPVCPRLGRDYLVPDLKDLSAKLPNLAVLRDGSIQVAGWIPGEACQRTYSVQASGKVVQHFHLASRTRYKRCPGSVGATGS
jgi:hypothetical protein